MTRYNAFIEIVDSGSFTRAAEKLGYTQSAVSQMVRSLEKEFSTTLIERSHRGIRLTPDGEELLPYIRNLQNSHRELLEKLDEMQGLGSGTVRIGTIASVSCNWLPGLIKRFRETHPFVDFDLQMGEYTSIAQMIKEGRVDFGFVNPDAVKDLHTIPLATDEMLAVLPIGHPLSGRGSVSLEELAAEPFIFLFEGALNEPMEVFERRGLTPKAQFSIYDDYTIMSMVEQGLGVSILPELILRRAGYRIALEKIAPPVVRVLSLAYKNKKVLPIASRHFIDFVLAEFDALK